jgi:hypothetical protein
LIVRLVWLALFCVGCGSTASTPISVDATAPGRAIADDFLGVSVEWNQVRDYLGDGSGHARAPVVHLLSAFAAEGHRPQVRIGGNSEDDSWWNPTGLARPAGVSFDITNADLATLGDLQSQVGSEIVLGLNLLLGDANNAAALVTAANAAVPKNGIAAFELGNEPDVFASDGHRPASYDWAAYLAEMRAFRDGVAARLPSPPPFQWPAIARRDWLPDLATQIPSEVARTALVTTHTYPYSVCGGLNPPAPSALLNAFATVQLVSDYAVVAKAAHDAGAPYRMGELNSVSCGGAPGVSDVYAAALWGADICMQLAGVGADGVNFHGGNAPGMRSYYAPFELDASGAPVVRPLYYGLRLVSLATAAHGRLLPATVTQPANAADVIHAFATLGDDGAVRILALRVRDAGSDSVSLTIAAMAGTKATLVRLHGASLDAQNGLTLGGATWDGSQDGAAIGTLREEPLTRDGAGWRFTLPAYDAVVVTVSP